MVTNRPSYEQFAALIAETIKPGGLSSSLTYDSDAFALVEAPEGAPVQRLLLGHYFTFGRQMRNFRNKNNRVRQPYQTFECR